MQEYRAARRRDIEELLRQASMIRHLGAERPTALRMVERLPEDVLAD
jgi:hypothetical protein